LSRIQSGTALLFVGLTVMQVIAAAKFSWWWLIPAAVTVVAGIALMVVQRERPAPPPDRRRSTTFADQSRATMKDSVLRSKADGLTGGSATLGVEGSWIDHDPADEGDGGK
jgi:cell division protein FtsW (lipid II flippase)